MKSESAVGEVNKPINSPEEKSTQALTPEPPPVCVSCCGSGTGHEVHFTRLENGEEDIEVEAGPCPACEGVGYG